MYKPGPRPSTTTIDKFRIRDFVDRLIEIGEVEIREDPVALSDRSTIIEATPKAVLFRNVGPERHEVIASLGASRKRLAAAFGVPEDQVAREFQRRLANPQRGYEVSSKEAPAQEVILTGDQVDLTKLPFHVQHEYDGAPYISSGIDYSYDPVTGRGNVGARRLMLRGKNKCGVNVTAPSDLREVYLACVKRGERLPISFTIGSHPVDLMASTHKATGDEFDRISTYRGEPTAMVKCVTNDIYVPADAEMVLEGYFDERGYVENEGPYGEYMGFYGPMHGDPVFHVTAITRRRDPIFQTIKHGVGRKLGECDMAPMREVQSEAAIMSALRQAGIDFTDIYLPPGPGSSGHARVAIRKKSDGDPRTVIALVLANVLPVKHCFVTDDDIDIRDHAQFEWAMSTRFQADKDIVVLSNMKNVPMDPSAPRRGIGAKAGFDCTFPFPRSNAITARIPEAPKIEGPARFQTVRQALEEAGPMHFAKIMTAVGSRDGREIVLEIERLRDERLIERNEDGDYYIKRG